MKISSVLMTAILAVFVSLFFVPDAEAGRCARCAPGDEMCRCSNVPMVRKPWWLCEIEKSRETRRYYSERRTDYVRPTYRTSTPRAVPQKPQRVASKGDVICLPPAEQRGPFPFMYR